MLAQALWSVAVIGFIDRKTLRCPSTRASHSSASASSARCSGFITYAESPVLTLWATAPTAASASFSAQRHMPRHEKHQYLPHPLPPVKRKVVALAEGPAFKLPLPNRTAKCYTHAHLTEIKATSNKRRNRQWLIRLLPTNASPAAAARTPAPQRRFRRERPTLSTLTSALTAARAPRSARTRPFLRADAFGERVRECGNGRVR